MGKIVTSEFKPPYWLSSPHIQTIWSTAFRSLPKKKPEWERVELDDGDFLDLAWFRRDKAPVVLLIHGLEGSFNSPHTSNMLLKLYEAHYSAVLLHLRGRGREVNRLDQSYHSGRTDDLRRILQYLNDNNTPAQAIIGISLGANLLLKHLGEVKEQYHLKTAIAISPPFQLEPIARHLSQGIPGWYGFYLLRQLKQSWRRKFQSRPAPFTVDLDQIKTLYQFDDCVTAPLHGFTDARDYYQQCSCAQFLSHIQCPTLIIQACDDPFFLPELIPEANDLSNSTVLELSAQGGHVGFIDRKLSRQTRYWLEHRIVKHLFDWVAI